MKPIIKYRGGKLTEIKYFASFFPQQFQTFFEPFVGGGAVYFYLEHPKCVINDINARLIEFYRDLKENYAEVRRQLDLLQHLYLSNQQQYEIKKARAPADRFVENANEALYYQFRKYFNYPSKEWLNSVVYYFINKTSYSGMIRYNRNGEYNVPFGRYKYFNMKRIGEAHHRLLLRTEIYNTDYADIFKIAGTDDFMFLDPPYDTVFNDYGNIEFTDGFDDKEHVRLADEFKKLKCKALMVIGQTDLTYRLYKDYIVAEYDKTYAVNIRNRFKNEVKHLIVKNY